MTLWLDAQLSPGIALWIREELELDAIAVRELGLRDATDLEIFEAARAANAVAITKDRDFVTLLDRHGPPPRVIWITCGNTSNAKMRQILSRVLSRALELVEQGEALVEVSG